MTLGNSSKYRETTAILFDATSISSFWHMDDNLLIHDHQHLTSMKCNRGEERYVSKIAHPRKLHCEAKWCRRELHKQPRSASFSSLFCFFNSPYFLLLSFLETSMAAKKWLNIIVDSNSALGPHWGKLVSKYLEKIDNSCYSCMHHNFMLSWHSFHCRKEKKKVSAVSTINVSLIHS